jgi:phospholipid/cholesterol/gamma-HCH transport system ATP-binding protein
MPFLREREFTFGQKSIWRDESVTDPMIQVIDLFTSYGDLKVLDGVSLEISPGEITAIVGSSGCGKTTLLRHMIGLLKPTAGSILVRGVDVTTVSEKALDQIRIKQGVLFQNGGLFNSMSLAENVALPLREHTELEESTIRIMTRMKLELVGLLGFEDFFPAQISGGMRKRAGLARAISMDPEVLYFDEPNAGLDPITSAEMDELILRLKGTFGMTIVIVTHELPSIQSVPDRVIMLDKGKAIFSGTRNEMLASQDPRIRKFLDRRPGRASYDSGELPRYVDRQ